MTVLSIVIGVLLMIGGFSCMFTPLATFLSTGYYFAVLLLVYGITGILRFCKKEAGALELIVSILAVPAGLIALFRPGRILLFDGMALSLIAAWLTVQGISSIVLGFSARGAQKGWYWGVISGVFGVLVGLYSFAHPVLTAMTAGFLIGLYFVESGFSMIALGGALSAAKRGQTK